MAGIRRRLPESLTLYIESIRQRSARKEVDIKTGLIPDQAPYVAASRHVKSEERLILLEQELSVVGADLSRGFVFYRTHQDHLIWPIFNYVRVI